MIYGQDGGSTVTNLCLKLFTDENDQGKHILLFQVVRETSQVKYRDPDIPEHCYYII